MAAVVKLVDGAQLRPMQKLFRDEIGFVAGIANIVCVTLLLCKR